ncbi:MAG: cobalamin B12-binding domain-containing protein [Cyanobacteria bacterium NC_groundwater_1444_Ag_S-0.65um_54_12]|nr:cobalamin B12-binding domain-containing protein [Cyanobacteria bacterium NC_groundwater_1444_Ag_S-0.65um_54_12]
MTGKKIRILLGKVGLDGHDRGVKVIARALCDAGMEVIYTGLQQSPADIATIAVQEDVDVVGLSLLSGAHLTLVPATLECLRSQGAGHVPVLVGGIIPVADAESLLALGVSGVFGPGTPLDNVISAVREAVAAKAAEPESVRFESSPGKR